MTLLALFITLAVTIFVSLVVNLDNCCNMFVTDHSFNALSHSSPYRGICTIENGRGNCTYRSFEGVKITWFKVDAKPENIAAKPKKVSAKAINDAAEPREVVVLKSCRKANPEKVGSQENSALPPTREKSSGRLFYLKEESHILFSMI